MKTFLDFLRKYNYLFLFLLLEVVSFVMLFRFNNYQGSVWFSAANGVAAKANSIYSEAAAYLNLKQVNGLLTRQNILLSQENDLLRQQLSTLHHDTTATEARLRSVLDGFTLTDAQVVSATRRRSGNYLVINRGTDDGITPEMGVIGGNGVVGIVYLTAKNNSLVIPITNPKSSISCRVRSQSYFGYLQWDSRDIRYAYVNDIPRYANVQEGAVIETSGYSAVFPPGLFIGRVTHIENSPDGQSYRLRLKLGTSFANLHNVCVVKTPYKAQIDTLLSNAARQDSRNASGGI